MLTGEKPTLRKRLKTTGKIKKTVVYLLLKTDCFMEITNLLVTCKLSDGSVREVFTNRETEVEILKTILSNSPTGEINISDKPVLGLDIILPKNALSLSEYLK